MACSSSMARTFPNMDSIRQASHPSGVGTQARRITARPGSFWGMRGASGATLLDRRLYLPESWFAEDHQTLWQDCRIPDETLFQTKHELAAQLVEKVVADGRLKGRWVVCD